MSISNSKNNWALFLLLLAGIVLGGFIGELTRDVSFLSWLSYGKTFGLSAGAPAVLDLGIMVISLGLQITINIASIIGVVIAILIYKFL